MDIELLISRFRKLIQKEIEGIMSVLADGGADDIVSYREQCARIRALNFALSEFNEVVKNLSVDVDD